MGGNLLDMLRLSYDAAGTARAAAQLATENLAGARDPNWQISLDIAY